MNLPAANPQPLGELIARLSALHPKRIDLSLDRMHRLLARLDHPEATLPPVIHVAGTNGKGSTIAYLRATLEAAGLRVHVYTSPYLVRINECFRIGEKGGGRLADDAELRRVLEHCEQVNAGEPITIFEMETAAAFCLFAEHEADVVLLETGLGGRLDATNVIDRPIATVITPVSMDHTEFLGSTLTAIAGEKAAIIKRGAPVICAEQAPEAMSVIDAQGKRMRAPLHVAGQQWHVGVERGRLVYQDERGLMDLAAPKLFGRHQFDNAGLAIATLRAVEAFKIGMPAFEAGIVGAEWPARMQRLVAGALVDQGPKGRETLARRRAQCGRRTRHGCCARRSRRAGIAPAGGDRGHDGEQGCGRVPRQFRRADAPHHDGADPGPRQCDAAGSPRRCGACARHARGKCCKRRSRATGAVAAGI